jgi:hypothetical protein
MGKHHAAMIGVAPIKNVGRGQPMTIKTMSFRQSAGFFATALMLLVGSGAAWADTYDPVTRHLTISKVIVGATSYSGMVVTIGSVVSAPSGTAPNSSEDAYDTASGRLAIPQVTVGAKTYYNVVATVAGLVSSGSLSNSDSYDGTHLTIPYVQVGANVYFNAVITIGSIVSHGSGMPENPRDVFDSSTHHLTIASIQYGGIVYTNTVVTVATVTSVGGLSPQVTFTASYLSFLCVQYCSPKTVALINTGATTLNITSITASGLVGIYHAFSESNNCPGSLGAGQSCAISVNYVGPGGTGAHGDLIVTDNGTGSPQTVPLQGSIY